MYTEQAGRKIKHDERPIKNTRTGSTGVGSVGLVFEWIHVLGCRLQFSVDVVFAVEPSAAGGESLSTVTLQLSAHQLVGLHLLQVDARGDARTAETRQPHDRSPNRLVSTRYRHRKRDRTLSAASVVFIR